LSNHRCTQMNTDGASRIRTPTSARKRGSRQPLLPLPCSNQETVPNPATHGARGGSLRSGCVATVAVRLRVRVGAALAAPPAATAQPPPPPQVGVVVQTLNEARLIIGKLRALRRSAYPAERMTIVVVDGGSTDGTVELVQREIAAGMAAHLIHDAELRGKAAQLNRALATLSQEIVIVTDVDARLDPQCIAELVRVVAGGARAPAARG